MNFLIRRGEKMNRELWIKDIIGKVLEPEGFSYIGRELQPKEFF